MYVAFASLPSAAVNVSEQSRRLISCQACCARCTVAHESTCVSTVPNSSLERESGLASSRARVRA